MQEESNTLNLIKMCNLPSFFPSKEKKTPFTQQRWLRNARQECCWVTIKGVWSLKTMSLCFIPSSSHAMLCVQTSSSFSTPAHKKAIKYLQLTESRAIQVLQDCTGEGPNGACWKSRSGDFTSSSFNYSWVWYYINLMTLSFLVFVWFLVANWSDFRVHVEYLFQHS